ncbi:MAG: ribonuclease HII [Euryarchaeota archaeon]|nr:ribonuclease HII [Euryarchaeota archaeon]
MTTVAGVDEAGKGAVIGSLFIAGVCIDSDSIKYLQRMALRDSKDLSRKRRELLAMRIEKVGEVGVHEVTAEQIDELRDVITMNDIIVRGHARVLHNLQPDCAYVDAADVNAERFGLQVKERSGIARILAEHNADKNHVLVSAASIIAKVRRDESIKRLESRLECNIGSGYPSDAITVNFLAQWLREHDELPPETRKSWKTAQNLVKFGCRAMPATRNEN